MHVGASPGMDSEFFSFCYESVVPATSDLYLIELDVNNEPTDATLFDDDALFRGLLGLPQKPAVIRLSAFALGFSDLVRGSASALIMSTWFDVPVIGIRNFMMPHLVAHPKDADIFFAHAGPNIDPRHIGYLSHQAAGDMLALYMRKETSTPKKKSWP
ncbi:hypothetical protein RQP46_000197 [Phenoliferia psychrophenolica]